MTETQNSSFNAALLHMTVATLAFSIQELIVKSLTNIPTEQIVFFRSIVALFICYVSLRRCGEPLLGTHRKLLFLRGLFGTCGLFLYFYSFKVLPYATASALQKISPIFVALFAIFILNQKLSKKSWLFFIIALIGALVIKGFDHNVPVLPFGLALLGSAFAGLAYNMIGKIGSKEHPMTIIFYFPLVTLPFMTPLTILHWVQPTPFQWISLLGLGVIVQAAQYYMTKAFMSPYTAKVGVIYYSGSILAVIFGYLIFNETLTASTYLGIGLILTGVIGSSLIKEKTN